MKKLFDFLNIKILTLLALYWPLSAFAFELKWDSPREDKSLFYLGQVFGQVGTALSGSGNQLIGSLFSIFNIAVLSLGTMVVAYSLIVSTISTAQEGEVMGRKWSSIWLPLKSAVGISFMLPTTSGYSLLQIMMMWIVVQGVHAGNQVWAMIIDFTKVGPGITGKITVNDKSLQTASEALFESLTCARLYNSVPDYNAAIGGGIVTAYRDPNNYDRIYLGVKDSPYYSNVCGGLQANSSTPSGVLSKNAWLDANVAGFFGAASNLEQYAVEAVEFQQDPLSWNGQGIIRTAMNTLKGNIGSVPREKPKSADAVLDSAKKTGWLFAGSYYYHLIERSKNFSYPGPTVVAPSYDTVGSKGSEVWSNAQSIANKYLAFANSGDLPSSGIIPSPANQDGSQLLNTVSDGLQSLASKIMSNMTEGEKDPMSSFRKMGGDIMAWTELIWLSVLAAAAGLALLGCIKSAISPTCMSLLSAISILVPVLTILLFLFWSAGAAIGIYLPLVPYIVFTFTAIGWMILVVETIVAAPIVALGLVSPSQEYLGRASPSVLLITNVFLRPSLMVIGFIAGAKLLEAVIAMLNFGFQGTLKSSVYYVGMFGVIAVITIYAGIAMALVHQCFSLIHILPDRVIRWIGGQAERSDVMQQAQQLEQKAQKGGEVGTGVAKGISQKASERAGERVAESKQAAKNLPAGPPGGGAGPGGGNPPGKGG